MILIADSGSTKCDWIAIDDNKQQFQFKTKGLNPSVFDMETIQERIIENADLVALQNQIKIVYFYGAGCGTITPRENLKKTLEALFTKATIHVKEDMYAAVYAVTNQPAIVCILGTGSNSCYFDGAIIHSNIPSLGYTIMDEASGNHIGKQLLRDYFYKKMPEAVAAQFQETYDLNPDVIKQHLYKKDNPNTYLAEFAHFVFSQDLKNPYFYNLVTRAFAEFVENHVLCFDNASELSIHFIGSIAHYGKNILEEVLLHNGLKLGKTLKKPIDGLIAYHLK